MSLDLQRAWARQHAGRHVLGFTGDDPTVLLRLASMPPDDLLVHQAALNVLTDKIAAEQVCPTCGREMPSVLTMDLE